MNTFELVKSILSIETELYSDSGESIVKYYNFLFTQIEEWMTDNQVIASRMNHIILDNPYFGDHSEIKNKTVNSLRCEKALNIIKLISLADDQSRKVWDRLKMNTRIKSSERKMEIAVLLTTALGKQLRESQVEAFSIYIRILKHSLDILEIKLSANTLVELCPFNFMKAFNDWTNVLNESYSGVMSLQLNYYDLLCCTLYLAIWKQQVANNSEVGYVSEQWKYYLSDCANNLFSKEKNEQEKVEISHQLSFLTENENGSKSDSESKLVPISGSTNELSRDPRFLRQANLYYDIDAKAINKVLRETVNRDLIVLDLGCGDGEVTCSRFGKIRNVSQIIAIDKDQKQLEQARARAKEQGISEKMLFFQLDMENPDFVDRLSSMLRDYNIFEVDIVFAAMSLHSINEPEITVGKIVFSVLKEGGFFIIREVDDETKIYYSKSADDRNYMIEAANEYKKIFGFTDRNCARKMYSWLLNQGMQNIEVFYDVVDTCNKSITEKNDIFNVTQGFRKARAEKQLKKITNDNTKKTYEESCRKIIDANDQLLRIYHNPDFWFCFTNYVAVAQKPISYSEAMRSPVLSRDIELLIIRHAEGVFDEIQNTYIVNEAGKKQIKELSHYLENIEIDEICCSTLDRAVKTAKPIACSHNLQLDQYEELKEIDRGRIVTDEYWRLNLHRDYYELWRQHKTDMEFPGGENGEAVWFRAKYVLDTILEHAKKDGNNTSRPYRACVVTHGGTIRTIICGMLNIPQTYRYQFMEKINNCSISVLKIQSDYSDNPNTAVPVTLEKINDTSFLERGSV